MIKLHFYLTIFFVGVFLVNCSVQTPPSAPKERRLAAVHGFLLDVLDQPNLEDDILLENLRSRLDARQTAQVASICRVLAERSTEMTPEQILDAELMGRCFVTCLRRLNEQNAVPELRSIYFDVRLEDGWLDLWNHVLGSDWRERLKIEQ